MFKMKSSLKGKMIKHKTFTLFFIQVTHTHAVPRTRLMKQAQHSQSIVIYSCFTNLDIDGSPKAGYHTSVYT